MGGLLFAQFSIFCRLLGFVKRCVMFFQFTFIFLIFIFYPAIKILCLLFNTIPLSFSRIKSIEHLADRRKRFFCPAPFRMRQNMKIFTAVAVYGMLICPASDLFEYMVKCFGINLERTYF